MGENRRAIGNSAEEEALRFLREKGYTILERNYCRRGGEIDIIARDGTYTVFVEVKYRQSSEYGFPYEAVNGRKQQRIIRTAIDYIKQHSLAGTDTRFDVVSVSPDSIEHIPSAFQTRGYHI